MVGYYHGDTQSLKFALCNDLACAGMNETINTIDSTNVVGQYVSLAVGFQDRPTFAYFDASLLDLKWARCGNDTCSTTIDIDVVDSDGDVGRHASMVMSGSNSLISYYDGTNMDLKYMRCSGFTSCTSGTMTTLASDGDVGLEGAMFYDALRNRPIVVYQDDAGDIFVAACSNAFCSSVNLSPTSIFFANGPPAGTMASNGLPLLAVSSSSIPRSWACSDADCTSGDDELLPRFGNQLSEDVAIAVDPFGYPVIAIGRATQGIELVRCGTRDCLAP